MSRMVKRYGSGRLQATGGGGRFTRNTLENVAGLRVVTCPAPDCRQFNPYGPTEEGGFQTWVAPTHCHACGAALATAVSPEQP
jgi:hypothetical protein